MDKNINICDKLTFVRKDSRLTQAEFAERLGVKQSYYSDLERGKREVTAKIIESLIKNFNISSDWFLSDRGDMHIDTNITNVDKKSDLIEKNKTFIDDYYYGGLKSNSYEYRQIQYYEGLSINKLTTLKKLELDSFKTSFENNRKLIDLLHYLAPSRFTLTSKFTLLDSFDDHLKKTESERKDMMKEAGQLDDVKLKTILQILQYKEEKEHWNSMLTILIDYLDIYKQSLKSRINNPNFKEANE